MVNFTGIQSNVSNPSREQTVTYEIKSADSQIISENKTEDRSVIVKADHKLREDMKIVLSEGEVNKLTFRQEDSYRMQSSVENNA